MEIQNEIEAFERFKAKQIGIDYETLKKDLDDCEKRFPNNRYAGWNFKSDWELWQAATALVNPKWISVEDKQPRYGEPILIAIMGVVQKIIYMRDGSDNDDDWCEPYYLEHDDRMKIYWIEVSHWMLLPQAPKAQE